MSKAVPQTFGLLSESEKMRTFMVKSWNGNTNKTSSRKHKAKDLDNLRRNLIADARKKHKYISAEISEIHSNGRTFLGTLDIPDNPWFGPNWQVKGKNGWTHVDPKTGRLV